MSVWSKDIRKEKKLNIYTALIKSSLLYGSETWRLTENNKRRVETTEMDALRRSSRISRKERIRNVTIRQQIGLEETIIKDWTEPAHMVWPCSKNGRRKSAQNCIEVDAKTKESTKKTEEKLDGRNKEGHERKKPKWRPVGRQEAMESRCRTTQKNVLKPTYVHTHTHIHTYIQEIRL